MTLKDFKRIIGCERACHSAIIPCAGVLMRNCLGMLRVCHGKRYPKYVLGRAVPMAVKLIAGKLKTSLVAFKFFRHECALARERGTLNQ